MKKNYKTLTKDDAIALEKYLYRIMAHLMLEYKTSDINKYIGITYMLNKVREYNPHGSLKDIDWLCEYCHVSNGYKKLLPPCHFCPVKEECCSLIELRDKLDSSKHYISKAYWARRISEKL